MSTTDPTDLHAIDAQAEADQALREAESLKQAADVQWLMGTEAGRRIAWRMLERTRAFQTPFAGSDAQTNFNCGERNVGLWFLDELMTHCPDAYLQMLMERTKT